MLKLLRKKYINLIIPKLKKQQKLRSAVYKNYDEVKNVLLLADVSDVSIYEHIKSIKNKFTKDGKRVGTILFVWDKTTSEFFATSSTAKVITEDNFSWNGKPDSGVGSDLTGYDLLINLNEGESVFIDYLTLLAKVDLKAGAAKNDQSLLDFMVDTGDSHDIEFLADQIIFYLRTIKSKT